MSTLTCAGRRPAPARDVTSVTKASARSWSNDRPLSGLARSAAIAASNGGGDHGVGFGVQGEVGVAHPGLPVGPAAQRSLRPQPLRRGEPVTLEAAGEIGDVTFERVHRRRRRHRHQRLGLRRPARRGPVRRPGRRPGRSRRRARPPPRRTPTRRAAPAARHTRAPRAATTRTSRDARPAVSTSGTDSRAGAGRDGGFDGVEPATDLSHEPGQLRQCYPITSVGSVTRNVVTAPRIWSGFMHPCISYVRSVVNENFQRGRRCTWHHRRWWRR